MANYIRREYVHIFAPHYVLNHVRSLRPSGLIFAQGRLFGDSSNLQEVPRQAHLVTWDEISHGPSFQLY